GEGGGGGGLRAEGAKRRQRGSGALGRRDQGRERQAAVCPAQITPATLIAPVICSAEQRGSRSCPPPQGAQAEHFCRGRLSADRTETFRNPHVSPMGWVVIQLL